MRVLALDTALGAASVGVFDANTGAMVAARAEAMDRGHAERLMPIVADVLAECRISPADIGLFAAAVGPGSFTGIRIAVSAARAFAMATGTRSVGVTTLQALAFPHRGRPVAAVVDARHGHVFAAVFAADDGVIVEPAYVTLAAAADLAARHGAGLVGPGARLVASALTGFAPVFVDECAYPSIEAIARLALTVGAEATPARPLYLKAVDAKPQWPVVQGAA